MPEQVPSHVLELYKNGGMSPEQMSEFEGLVQSGELVVSAPQPEQPMPQKAPSPLEDATPTTAGVYQEPEQQFTGEELALSGFDTTPKKWPHLIGGKPVLSEDLWSKYQRRTLDYPTRMAVEKGIESGKYVLPEGIDLNMVPKDRTLKEVIGDVFKHGALYEAGKGIASSWKGQRATNLPGVMESQEAFEAGSLFGLSASTAGQQERAQMAEGKLGFERLPSDFYNNPVLKSPQGKKFTVQSGADPADVVGATAVAVPSIIAGALSAPITTAYGVWAGIGALGLSDMAIESVVQIGQAKYSGDFDKMDVALAGALSVVPDAGAEVFKSYSRKELIKSAKDAIKNNDMVKFDKIYQDNPEVMDIVTQGVDLKYDPTTKTFKESIDFNQSMKNLARKADSKARQEAFARSLGLDKDAFKDFEEAGVGKSASLLEVADHRDSKTRQLVSSIKEHGSDSLESQKISRDIGLKDDFVSKMEKMGATKDKGALSKTINDVMTNDIKKDRSLATPKYERITSASKDFSFNADETLAHLDEIGKRWAKRDETGEVVADASSPYTSFEKKVKNALTSTKVDGEQFVILDQYGNPIEIDYTQFEALSPLIRIKSLKEEAGSMMKDVNFSTNEQRKASELYNMLKRDEERAIKELAAQKGDPTLYDDWVEATDLWNGAKTKEKAMQELFGSKIKDNLFSNVGEVKKELSETAIEETEAMLDALPKQYRSPYLKTALLDAMGSKPEKMKLAKFGEWYEGFKDSSRGMMLLKKHMEPEEFKEFIGMGKVASRMNQAKENLKKGGNIDKVKEIVGAKEGLVKGLVHNVMVYSGGGLVSGALMGLLPAGAGGVGLPLAVLGAGKALKDHVGKKKFGKFLDLINSKEFLDLAESQDNSQVYVRALSKTEHMKQFMKLIGKSQKQSDIETFIKTSLRTGLQTERRSDNNNDNTGEQ